MQDAELNPLFLPILSEHGLELEHLTVKAAGRRRIVQVVVDGDGPDGRGPLLDDISAAAHALNHAVDERDPSGVSPYTIEVSSRGVSRPLTQPQHWRRNRGRLVQVVVGEEQVTGRVQASDDERVTLEVAGAERGYAYSELGRALVQVEFNRPRTDVADHDEDEGGAADDDEDDLDEVAEDDADEAEQERN